MHRLLGYLYRLLYNLDHFYFFEVRMHTWANWLLIMLTVLALLFGVPGRHIIAGLFLALILLLSLGSRYARRRRYIHFVPETPEPPEDPPPPLWPQDKLLHHATGHFEVEGKEADWTRLIAYYRTFETREHAIMARLTPMRFLKVGELPPQQLGMWYRFIDPENLLEATPGRIYFGGQVEPGLRLRYRRFDEKGKAREDIFFLHFDTEADRTRVLADLLLDMGGPARRPWRRDALLEARDDDAE